MWHVKDSVVTECHKWCKVLLKKETQATNMYIVHAKNLQIEVVVIKQLKIEVVN